VNQATKERLAEALVVLAERTVPLSEGSRKEAKKAALEGIENGNPDVMSGVGMIQDIVSAYYGASSLELEINARMMIELVANGNKAKRFVLPIIDGEGVGIWEMIIRRVREAEVPSIVVPGSKQWPSG